MFTATVTAKYKEIFDDSSKRLLVKCLEWLFKTTKGAGDIFALIMETKNNFPEASLDILHELLSVGNETLQVPGWGRLRYFDLEERKIGFTTTLANIPNVGTQ